jgi:hypothetical protein
VGGSHPCARQKLIEILKKIYGMICLSASMRCNQIRRWSMKVTGLLPENWTIQNERILLR